jgi:NADPH-dependent 2,4-dienoyl-CoA reductase/sulfur reductase-like enzyme
VQVKTKHGIQGIVRKQNDLAVQTTSGETITTDFVLMATGVQPNTQVAQSAGIPLGAGGAIGVDRFMATEIPGIWAAGDCVQTWHRLLQRDVYMPLGTTAHKQGRVAGENMVGGRCEFQGSLGTQSVKIFDQVAACTGLNDISAQEGGFQPLTVALETWDHKRYYPGATPLHIRVTGDRISGQLLGLQMVGNHRAEISKRIDVVATALFHEMRVEDICDLDLSYTPPLSSPWDPIQMAGMQWCRE